MTVDVGEPLDELIIDAVVPSLSVAEVAGEASEIDVSSVPGVVEAEEPSAA